MSFLCGQNTELLSGPAERSIQSEVNSRWWSPNNRKYSCAQEHFNFLSLTIWWSWAAARANQNLKPYSLKFPTRVLALRYSLLFPARCSQFMPIVELTIGPCALPHVWRLSRVGRRLYMYLYLWRIHSKDNDYIHEFWQQKKGICDLKTVVELLSTL